MIGLVHHLNRIFIQPDNYKRFTLVDFQPYEVSNDGIFEKVTLCENMSLRVLGIWLRSKPAGSARIGHTTTTSTLHYRLVNVMAIILFYRSSLYLSIRVHRYQEACLSFDRTIHYS